MMAKAEILTLKSLTQLANLNALYLLGYAWVFGMSVWVTFFGGLIAFRVLPRHHFGALQHKTFPVYFLLSINVSSALLGLWIWKHPDVLQQLSRPNVADVAQVYALGSAIFFQASNYFVIVPLTSMTMTERQKLEKEEGKLYTDPGVSQEMKILNGRFGMLHGMSSLANLFVIIALLFHGLWIGNAGVTGY